MSGNITRFQQVMNLPMTDPGMMPVTRDLAPVQLTMINAWFANPNHEGLTMKTSVLASLGMLCALQLAAQPAVPQFTIEPRSGLVQRYDSRARPALIRARDRPVGAVAHRQRAHERTAHVHVIVENRRAAGECIPAAAGEQPAVGDRSEREEGLSTGEHSGAAARRFARRHECRVV